MSREARDVIAKAIARKASFETPLPVSPNTPQYITDKLRALERAKQFLDMADRELSDADEANLSGDARSVAYEASNRIDRLKIDWSIDQ